MNDVSGYMVLNHYPFWDGRVAKRDLSGLKLPKKLPDFFLLNNQALFRFRSERDYAKKILSNWGLQLNGSLFIPSQVKKYYDIDVVDVEEKRKFLIEELVGSYEAYVNDLKERAIEYLNEIWNDISKESGGPPPSYVNTFVRHIMYLAPSKEFLLQKIKLTNISEEYIVTKDDEKLQLMNSYMDEWLSLGEWFLNRKFKQDKLYYSFCTRVIQLSDLNPFPEYTLDVLKDIRKNFSNNNELKKLFVRLLEVNYES